MKYDTAIYCHWKSGGIGTITTAGLTADVGLESHESQTALTAARETMQRISPFPFNDKHREKIWTAVVIDERGCVECFRITAENTTYHFEPIEIPETLLAKAKERGGK